MGGWRKLAALLDGRYLRICGDEDGKFVKGSKDESTNLIRRCGCEVIKKLGRRPGEASCS